MPLNYYHHHTGHNAFIEQYSSQIISAIKKWLKLNFMDIFIEIVYVKFITFVCLIGCSSLQHSKAPWEHVAKAIEMLNNEEMRSLFIDKLKALYQKHKYGSQEFCLKLADLVVDHASMS